MKERPSDVPAKPDPDPVLEAIAALRDDLHAYIDAIEERIDEICDRIVAGVVDGLRASIRSDVLGVGTNGSSPDDPAHR